MIPDQCCHIVVVARCVGGDIVGMHPIPKGVDEGAISHRLSTVEEVSVLG